MRQIVLDTETTGLGHAFGHKVIEIGCVEMINRKLTGNHFHVYLNPQREVDEGAFKVHGISTEFLQDKPLFKDVASDFLQFIEGTEIIIHNAPFDVGFLNAELTHIKSPKKIHHYCSVLDTLLLAKEKHPRQRNSLDALCKHYDVDNTNRQLHGALLDAEILAWVYLAMTGGQASLFIDDNPLAKDTKNTPIQSAAPLTSTTPVKFATPAEIALHDEFIEFLVKKSGVNHWENESEASEKVEKNSESATTKKMAAEST